MTDKLCGKCGIRPCYEHNGRVFKLCSVCGWYGLAKFVELNEPDITTDDLAASRLEGVREGVVKGLDMAIARFHRTDITQLSAAPFVVVILDMLKSDYLKEVGK